ncbi:hypothetical protein Tco_0794262 [Tanacetum coccineum]
MAKNDEALQINLELLEEKREQAAITEAKSKRQMEKYYNVKVRNTSFKPGDLVYRNNEASRAEDTEKLGPKWEGPYEVTEALGKGLYRLKDRNGKELPRAWNVSNLKKCEAGIDQKIFSEHVHNMDFGVVISSKLHQLDTYYTLNVNDQDSLNSAEVVTFLDKRPADCSSHHRKQVPKFVTPRSQSHCLLKLKYERFPTSGVSPDVAELKDMVRALLLDKQTSPVPAPAPVKAIEQSCVTCGGAHSYRNCPATDSNNYRDNIQEYVSQAAAANFNQGNSGYRPPPMANQIRPPGFPPMQHNNQANNQNRWNQNQNRGNGYNRVKSNDPRKVSEYSQEVLGFSEVLANGNSTPYFEPIVDTTSPTLTPFEGSDFILEEIEAELSDTSYKSGIDDAECDPENDILLLEAILNSEPLSPLPNHANYFPEIRKELKNCEAKTDETSIDEPPEVELKDLPPHLEYAFLEGDNKLPVIIAKDLSVGEKAALIKVLQSHKRAIAWKLSDIKGINPEFCTHKILMEEDYTPAVQHQRRVNPKIHDVIKKEVEKLLNAGLIYPISDSPWNWNDPFELCAMQRAIPPSAVLGHVIETFQPIHYASKTLKEAESTLHHDRERNVSRENPHKNELDPKEINEKFPLETLSSIAALDSSTPWFADIANYHAGNFVIKGMSTQQKRKFFQRCEALFWEIISV